MCAGCCLSVGYHQHCLLHVLAGCNLLLLLHAAGLHSPALHPSPEMGLTPGSAPPGHHCGETPVSPGCPSLPHTHIVPSPGSGHELTLHSGESFWGCSAPPCHPQTGGCHPASHRAGDLSAVSLQMSGYLGPVGWLRWILSWLPFCGGTSWSRSQNACVSLMKPQPSSSTSRSAWRWSSSRMVLSAGSHNTW